MSVINKGLDLNVVVGLPSRDLHSTECTHRAVITFSILLPVVRGCGRRLGEVTVACNVSIAKSEYA